MSDSSKAALVGLGAYYVELRSVATYPLRA